MGMEHTHPKRETLLPLLRPDPSMKRTGGSSLFQPKTPTSDNVTAAVERSLVEHRYDGSFSLLERGRSMHSDYG